MYLAALGYDPLREAYQKTEKQAMETAGAGAGFCLSQGGVPRIVGSGFQTAYAGCDFPPRPQIVAAPQPVMGPVTITTPTFVATQISPQISPVFVQQDEPQNSPVNASTRASPTFDPGVIALQQEIARQTQAPQAPPDWLEAQQEIARQTPQTTPDWLQAMADELEMQREMRKAEAEARDQQPAYTTQITPLPEMGYAPQESSNPFASVPPLVWALVAGVGLIFVVRQAK